MNKAKVKLLLLILLVLALFISYFQVTLSQELNAGAKLIGTSPVVFAEAKLWIFSLELGVGPNLSADTSVSPYDNSGINYSLSGKIYPISIVDLSPYVGFTNLFSGDVYKQSDIFAGLEYDFSSGSIPLSAFAGGGIKFTEFEGYAGFGWHLGVKYCFSF